ncbi:hypothetical protein BS50DRAFT_372243 [Corynespora cassiicola Philippines]|uniref:Uncharacterized protein n=1 Tax=Corynespora cassiicola Philippines TaxID=1448308 RepID=A0A2T2NNS5_CORCC|nr:hypothetical protein BS50DRAFT_372243 [Corynespora cassiicola Philippines]
MEHTLGYLSRGMRRSSAWLLIAPLMYLFGLWDVQCVLSCTGCRSSFAYAMAIEENHEYMSSMMRY